MRTFIDAFERVTLTLAWIAAWLFVASGVMLSCRGSRTLLFSAPTKWAAELSQLCLIYGTLLSLCWLVQHRRHIQINAVTGLLSDSRQRLVGVITMLILVWFSLYVTYFGWTIFHDSFERGRTTGSLLISLWIELPVPLLFALCVQALIEIFKLVSGDPI